MSYGYYFEMRDLTDKFQVLINQTNETAQDGVAGIKKPFCDVVNTKVEGGRECH